MIRLTRLSGHRYVLKFLNYVLSVTYLLFLLLSGNLSSLETEGLNGVIKVTGQKFFICSVCHLILLYRIWVLLKFLSYYWQGLLRVYILNDLSNLSTKFIQVSWFFFRYTFFYKNSYSFTEWFISYSYYLSLVWFLDLSWRPQLLILFILFLKLSPRVLVYARLSSFLFVWTFV